MARHAADVELRAAQAALSVSAVLKIWSSGS